MVKDVKHQEHSLQWGRRLSSTETTGTLGRSTVRVIGFNGAVDSHRRRLRGRGAPDERVDASMGPSTLIDGDPLRVRTLDVGEGASMGPSTLIDGDR